MSNDFENGFDLTVKLKLFDYFRYYMSLFSIRLSGKLLHLVSAVIVTVYTISLFMAVYLIIATKDYKLFKNIGPSIIIIFLFSAPFFRAYLIAYKDAKAHKYLNKEMLIRITPEKFIVEPGTLDQEYNWKKMFRVYDFRSGFALFIDKKALAYAIPKRCFKSEEQIQFLREIINKREKEANKKETSKKA